MTDLRIDQNDFQGLVRHLADPVRARQALRYLIAGGSPARLAVRQGLTSSEPDIRMYSVQVLDHLIDDASWPDLIRMLEDPDPRVRVHTLHALACDRCKDDVSPPPKSEVLPCAIALLQGDPFYHVRLFAVEVVGRWVHSDQAAAAALVIAKTEDENPVVRKKAGWYAPGASIFRKAAPSK